MITPTGYDSDCVWAYPVPATRRLEALAHEASFWPGHPRDGRAIFLSRMAMAQPVPDDRHDIVLVLGAQPLTGSDTMPFGEAGSTAGRRRMLRDKDWMPAHRCLFAVIERQRGRQPLGNELFRMGEDRLDAAFSQIGLFLRVQPETRSECRSAKTSEERSEVVHADGI